MSSETGLKKNNRSPQVGALSLERRSVTKGAHPFHYLTCPHYPIYISILTTGNSGRKIVSILENNPDKDPDSYRDEDIEHMRKVVSYCKRHLAQEEKAKQNTDSKSYKSLKNWGHDPLKA
jgi:hypothetical protein